jgi:glycosyltransferase involved in cell wall biosynthesis
MTDIVWLSVETPDREGSGGQRRQFHQIRVLAGRGITLRALTLAGPQSDETLRELVPVQRFTARRRLRSGGLVPAALNGVAGAIVAHIESLPHVEDTLRRLRIPFALDFHNVHSRWHAARGATSQATRWERIERRALARAARVFACSREEARALAKLDPAATIEVASHGVDPAEWPESRYHREPAVALFGAWAHRPNRDAAEWLGTEVWPQIAREVPLARLLLLGPGEPPPLPDADHLGRVESLADALGHVRVAAVPIRGGIGARMKFGEALASGAAVVATSEGAEGFDAAGAFIVADDAGSFAQACIEFLRDEHRAREMGRRGRELALQKLTWERTSEPLVRWVESVTA